MFIADMDSVIETLSPPAPAPFTVDHFQWWLESRDPKESYDYMSLDDCMYARYYREMTSASTALEQMSWSTDPRSKSLCDFVHESGVAGAYDGYGTQTMGRALSRLIKVRGNRTLTDGDYR